MSLKTEKVLVSSIRVSVYSISWGPVCLLAQVISDSVIIDLLKKKKKKPNCRFNPGKVLHTVVCSVFGLCVFLKTDNTVLGMVHL